MGVPPREFRRPADRALLRRPGHHAPAGRGRVDRPAGVLAGAALVFFACLGFEDIANLVEEAINPGSPVGGLGRLVMIALLAQFSIAAGMVVAFVVQAVPWGRLERGSPTLMGARGDDLSELPCCAWRLLGRITLSDTTGASCNTIFI